MTALAFDDRNEAGSLQDYPEGVAMPVTFAKTTGLFQPARDVAGSADIAVLFASPWGYEDMCVRKFWRVLAETLSAAGIASLRFDYQGTGDALDFDGPDAGLAVWLSDLASAGEALRDLTGVKEIVVIGHGIGASLAQQCFADAEGVRGLALLAPVLSGRAYVREMSIWAQMIEEAPAKEGGSLVFGGIALPEPLVADIRKISLTQVSRSRVQHYFLASRGTLSNESSLSVYVRSLGAKVKHAAYEEYDALVHDLSTSRPPERMVAAVLDWVKEVSRPSVSLKASPKPAARLRDPRLSAKLEGEDFVETPIRFGDGDRLYGILCEPRDGTRSGATVIMLSTAYERASGWGRITTLAAREFAAKGIASLRFDPANVADSPALAGAPPQIIYSEAQHQDADAAISFIESRGLGPTILTGRCSGAYLAFRTAARDARVKGMVVVNAYTLFWDPKQSIDEWLQFSPQQLSSYGAKVLKLETWKKILRGDVNLPYAALNTFRFIRKRVLEFAGPLTARLPSLSREGREVHNALRAIQAHEADLLLMYRDNDVGLHHFSYHFGSDGGKLSKYSNARLVLVPDADRNMTKAHARAVYRGEILDMAIKHKASPLKPTSGRLN
jgi:pimeloyl-ACP methyl ester carboxylesterase